VVSSAEPSPAYALVRAVRSSGHQDWSYIATAMPVIASDSVSLRVESPEIGFASRPSTQLLSLVRPAVGSVPRGQSERGAQSLANWRSAASKEVAWVSLS